MLAPQLIENGDLKGVIAMDNSILFYYNEVSIRYTAVSEWAINEISHYYRLGKNRVAIICNYSIETF